MNKRLNPRSASPLMCDFLVHYTGSAPFSIKPDMRLVSLQHVEEGNYRHWQLLLDEEAHLVYHMRLRLKTRWSSAILLCFRAASSTCSWRSRRRVACLPLACR